MSQIHRVEARACDRSGSADELPRFVVMVEIPDRVIAAMGNPRPSELQLKALGIAMNATWHERVRNYRTLQFPSWSSLVVANASPADHGVADFRARDGCQAWIVETPLATSIRA
jgi:hypothetical protein